jgi:hypothetical protein
VNDRFQPSDIQFSLPLCESNRNPLLRETISQFALASLLQHFPTSEPWGPPTKQLDYTSSIVFGANDFFEAVVGPPPQSKTQKRRRNYTSSIASVLLQTATAKLTHLSKDPSDRKRLFATKAPRQAGILLSFLSQDFELSSEQCDGTKIKTKMQRQIQKHTIASI